MEFLLLCGEEFLLLCGEKIEFLLLCGEEFLLLRGEKWSFYYSVEKIKKYVNCLVVSKFLRTFAIGYKTMVNHPVERTSDAQHNAWAFFMPIVHPFNGCHLVR